MKIKVRWYAIGGLDNRRIDGEDIIDWEGEEMPNPLGLDNFFDDDINNEFGGKTKLASTVHNFDASCKNWQIKSFSKIEE